MAVDTALIVSWTASDVLGWARGENVSLEDLQAVRDAEVETKNRVTVIEGLDAAIATREQVAPPAADPPVGPLRLLRVSEQLFSTVTVTKDCVIEGVSYDRGDVIVWPGWASIRKLNVLLSNRTLLPSVDPWQRRTDRYGFGSAPRKHPTPTSVSPAALAVV